VFEVGQRYLIKNTAAIISDRCASHYSKGDVFHVKLVFNDNGFDSLHPEGANYLHSVDVMNGYVELIEGETFISVTDDVGNTEEHTGLSVSYYKVEINNPTSGGNSYVAECNDIIEALSMDYATGNEFKAIWRRCAAKALGVRKKGYDDDVYDCEKALFFAERNLIKAQNKLNKDH
jgi:hypothetical protein